MKKEYDNMIQHEVWEKVDNIPPETHIITSRLILRVKCDENGQEKSLKSRLVAGGHRQMPWEYDQTFAPVVVEKTILSLLALANMRGMEIHQMDIDGAYLNSPIQETVYM